MNFVPVWQWGILEGGFATTTDPRVRTFHVFPAGSRCGYREIREPPELPWVRGRAVWSPRGEKAAPLFLKFGKLLEPAQLGQERAEGCPQPLLAPGDRLSPLPPPPGTKQCHGSGLGTGSLPSPPRNAGLVPRPLLTPTALFL